MALGSNHSPNRRRRNDTDSFSRRNLTPTLQVRTANNITPQFSSNSRIVEHGVWGSVISILDAGDNNVRNRITTSDQSPLFRILFPFGSALH